MYLYFPLWHVQILVEPDGGEFWTVPNENRIQIISYNYMLIDQELKRVIFRAYLRLTDQCENCEKKSDAGRLSVERSSWIQQQTLELNLLKSLITLSLARKNSSKLAPSSSA